MNCLRKEICHRVLKANSFKEILLASDRPQRSFMKVTTPPAKRAPGAVLGYGRVSREGQDLAQQRAALRAAGCTRLFEEKASGGRWDRPELHRLLDHLRPGDVVVVWKLGPLVPLDTKRREIAEAVISGRKTAAQMARMFGISPPTVSRIVAAHVAEGAH